MLFMYEASLMLSSSRGQNMARDSPLARKKDEDGKYVGLSTGSFFDFTICTRV